MTDLPTRDLALRFLNNGQQQLGEAEVRAWLGERLPFGAAVDCHSVTEAVRVSERQGGPVVLKVLSAGAIHKTDLGFVRIGLTDSAEVERAARELLEAAARLGLDDVHLSVQTQLIGAELALGINRDELGALCLVAAGGINVEVLADSRAAMAPLNHDEARELLRGLRIWRLLEGFRGAPAYDADAVAQLLVRLSELAIEVPEIAELDLNPVFAQASGCAIADARAVLRPAHPEERRDPSPELSRLFGPKRLAVIGGTSGPRKIGSMVTRYLQRHGFPGEVVAISRNGTGPSQVQTFRTVKEAGPVDLACIAVQADGVEGVLRDCVEADVPFAVIYSAGFAEAGAEGATLERRLTEVTRDRLRFVGPNSIGVVASRQRLYASFGMALEVTPHEDVGAGSVALISQSGAIASSLFSRSRDEFGIDLAWVVSVGNESDLGIPEFVSHIANDDQCSVICLFLEVIRRPEAFASAMKHAIAAGKAIIAVKTGTSDEGRAAAASHTGAMTGSDLAYSAFFRRHGVIRVHELRTMLAAAQGVRTAGPVGGRRVAIVSMSGGVCSLVADSCAAHGLQVPRFSQELQERLAEIIPTYGAVANPVDVTAGGIQDPSMVGRTMSLILDSGSVDLVLLQLSTNADPGARQIAADLVALSDRHPVPFLVGRLGSRNLAPEAMKVFDAAGMHVFRWTDELVAAASAAVEHGVAVRESLDQASRERPPVAVDGG